MKRQAITFDFHNTLVHCDEWFELEVRALPGAFVRWHEMHYGPLDGNGSIAGLDEAYRKLRTAIMAHGHELTAERSLAVILSQSGIHIHHEILEEGVHALMARTLEHAKAVHGAVETVEALSREGVPLGVVSSAVYHPFLEWALERFEIRDRFNVIVTSASCGYYKSRPEIYWQALDALGAHPSQSLHVGDSIRFDVGGASRAGMRTAWLSHGPVSNPAIEPNLTVSNLTGSAPQLIQLLMAT